MIGEVSGGLPRRDMMMTDVIAVSTAAQIHFEVGGPKLGQNTLMMPCWGQSIETPGSRPQPPGIATRHEIDRRKKPFARARAFQ